MSFLRRNKRAELADLKPLKLLFGKFPRDIDTIIENGITIRVGAERYSYNYGYYQVPLVAIIKCPTCGDEREVGFDTKSSTKWETIRRHFLPSPCQMCVESERKKNEMEAKLQKDAALRLKFAQAFTNEGVGGEITYDSRGVLSHPALQPIKGTNIKFQFEYNPVLPTWIAQDGSAASIQHFQRFALEIGAGVYVCEGFLLLSRVNVLSNYDVKSITNTRDIYQRHLDKMAAFQSESERIS